MERLQMEPGRVVLPGKLFTELVRKLPGGTVTVHLEEREQDILLSVTDTGIGIPEEHLERIFERFYRVDKSHSKEIGGTGLGLSIVKHAALILNAKVTVESTAGKGSCIRVSFPQ